MRTKYTPEQQIAAFWKKVDRSGGDDLCWLWTARLTHGGYGQIKWGGIYRKASRVSYELAHGKFPDELFVLHTCDNPQCVNPSHLFLGTQQDNMDDKVNKGRQARGERHGQCKLTDAQVSEIRQRYAAGGTSHRKLGAEYGVDHTQIGNIVKRKMRS